MTILLICLKIKTVQRNAISITREHSYINNLLFLSHESRFRHAMKETHWASWFAVPNRQVTKARSNTTKDGRNGPPSVSNVNPSQSRSNCTCTGPNISVSHITNRLTNMSRFPKLIPAFTTHVGITDAVYHTRILMFPSHDYHSVINLKRKSL
jgi:hypothetical protein